MAVKMPRTPSTDATAHRELVVLDPPMLGADVEALKTALRARLKARRLDDDLHIGMHNKFTHATWLACVEVGYALGLDSATYLKTDEHRGVCTIGAQRIYRDPAIRTPVQIGRAQARADRVKEGPRYYEQLAKTIAQPSGKGATAALAFAAHHIGVHEQPAGSNWGPKVSDWIKLAGYDSPEPWCGCFANACLVAAGLPSGASWGIGYVPNIVAHARAGRDGWKLIDAAHGRPGDLACFVEHGEYVHVELCEKPLSATSYQDIGGNTGGPNPANGGMVARTQRFTGGGFRIGAFARPPWGS